MNKIRLINAIVLAFSILSADSLTVIMVGDIMMGTTYPDVRLPPNDGADIFSDVAHVLGSADLTLGNLEGPLTDKGTCTKKIEKGRCYAFKTPPRYVEHLVNAGFDFFSLKNNHSNDFGPEGMATTINTLIDAGLQYGTDEECGEFDVNGRSIAIICFSASSWGNSIMDIERAQRLVAQMAAKNDIVIVSFHGGGEGARYMHTRDTFEIYLGWPRGNVVKLAHAVIDSGADLVWGHGPHVPRALEIYKDRLIAYSTGNFFTWGFNLSDERGFAPMVKAVLDSAGAFMHGEIASAVQRTMQYPKLDSLHRAAQLIKRLSLEDFPLTCPEISDSGMVLPRCSDVEN
jgi:hypothetical protein